MLQGLRTVIYKVDDLDAAKAFYTAVLGFGPYFDESFYVGFSVGGFELGLDPDDADVVRGNSGLAYWGVAHIEEAFEKIKTAGGSEVAGIEDVGGGIKVASLKDPSGNVFGIIENPHFKTGE